MLEFKEWEVWKKAREIVNTIYEVSRSFPKDEQFGLTLQLRRASISVISNIAEGCGRNTNKETIQFLMIARGSLYEAEAQIIIARDLKFIDDLQFDSIEVNITSCKKLLSGFIRYFKNDESKNTIHEDKTNYGHII